MGEQSKKRKILLTIGVIATAGSLAALGTGAAFTATTVNSGNNISSGTVKIDQHAGSTTLYSLTNRKPGDSNVDCLRVSYSGSITAAAVKLYVSSGITNGTQFNITVERGSGLTAPAADMNCTGFVASSTAYSGTLGAFPTSYAAGVDGKAAAATWAQSDTVDYRVTITQNDDPTPNAHTSALPSGTHSFTWEARS